MTTRDVRRRVFASVSVLLLLVGAACAERERISLEDTPPDPPTFIARDGEAADVASDASSEGSIPLECIGTQCPAPWTTCSSDTPCGTNLMNDRDNCGACGTSCAGSPEIHQAGACVNGTCSFVCTAESDAGAIQYRDCNGTAADGCESDVNQDSKNCGACGHACGVGEHCFLGHCGCYEPLVDCGGTCVDTSSADSNCGACGTVCQKPAVVCSPMPKLTRYGCVAAECGQLKCASGAADCNGDLDDGCASDGCETLLNTNDNCGGCGVACGPLQECRYESGVMKCVDTCAKYGLDVCGATDESPGKCSDLLTDELNCGMCGVRCETNAAIHVVGSCEHGLCKTECESGFDDCNGDPIDGCEVDLRIQPANCGVCGHACDLAAGQPCIDGRCLMVACDGGVTK